MNYQIILKQYQDSTPKSKESFKLEESFKLKEGVQEQIINASDCPCRFFVTRKKENAWEIVSISAQLQQEYQVPLSIAISGVKESWKKENYVFIPGAAYNGNRFLSKNISYPPYWSGENKEDNEPVITDIPRLSMDKDESAIQFRSGDMTTPAMGYYDFDEKRGYLIFVRHKVHGEYTGFTVSENLNEEKATFSVSVPAVREGKKYFFGDRADGSGFYPECKTPSDDVGMILRQGERLELQVKIFEFQGETLMDFFAYFNENRACMEKGENLKNGYSVPFSVAYDAIKEKYQRENWDKEGYYTVGTERHHEGLTQYWQAGWVGGGMNSYSFLLEDSGIAAKRSIQTLDFIVNTLQFENGWVSPMYGRGIHIGDVFNDTKGPVLLVRKNADLLYFMILQTMALRKQEYTDIVHIEDGTRKLCDAFVRFYKKNGQLGQFIDMNTDEIIMRGTASAAIAAGALALAYEYFGEKVYLETAIALGNDYYENYLERGIVNGGPGEICQAPDSESAFGMLEAFVQLYETTKEELWLNRAKECFEYAITWVMSYDFDFPEGTTAGTLQIHTTGTVFANAQNKHSAPGICTLSGNSILKLYRFTGDKKYLEWLSWIGKGLSQCVSLEDRPVYTLDKRNLPKGYINERVQTSDWEGKWTIGEFLYGSNWPEVSMLLTYVEVPGIYVDLARNEIMAMDHVKADMEVVSGEIIKLRVTNQTNYEARVMVLLDNTESDEIKHNYFDQMNPVVVPAKDQKEFDFVIK